MNNTMTLQGELANLEVKTSKAGKPYARAAVITKDGEDKSYEYPFTAFGKAVEQLQALPKDGKVTVSGYVKREDYTPEEGTTKTSFSLIGGKVEQAPENAGYKNAFTLSGFISTRNEDGKLEMKTSEAGGQYLKYALSVKRDTFVREGEPQPEAKYDTFFLTAFGGAAEKMVKYKKGDLVEISGNIAVDENGNVTQIARQGKLIREAESLKASSEQSAEKSAAQTNEQ